MEKSNVIAYIKDLSELLDRLTGKDRELIIDLLVDLEEVVDAY